MLSWWVLSASLQSYIFTGRREDPEIHPELFSEQINQWFPTLVHQPKHSVSIGSPPNTEYRKLESENNAISADITEEGTSFTDEKKDLSDGISILKWFSYM